MPHLTHPADRNFKRSAVNCGLTSFTSNIHLVLKWLLLHVIINAAGGFLKITHRSKYSHSWVIWRSSNNSLLFYQSEMHLEHRKWTVMFTFTFTFTKLCCPSQGVDCMCMSYLRYVSPLERIHWGKVYYRSLFYFKDYIVLCIRSLICWQKSDFSSSFGTNLPRKWSPFRRAPQHKCWKQYVLFETPLIPSTTEVSTLTLNDKHCR